MTAKTVSKDARMLVAHVGLVAAVRNRNLTGAKMGYPVPRVDPHSLPPMPEPLGVRLVSKKAPWRAF